MVLFSHFYLSLYTTCIWREEYGNLPAAMFTVSDALKKVQGTYSKLKA